MTQLNGRRYLRSSGRRKKRLAHSPQIILLILLLGIAATVGYVWERVQVLRQQIAITELGEQIVKLEAHNGYLRVELLRLSDTRHLQSAARRFGFIFPSQEQVVRLYK